MTLSIFNSLSKKKEIFVPLVPGHVSLYVCGVTVYDRCHIGHARTYLAFDVVTRYLRHLGYQVKYVRNITDIDDKIIRRAEENQESCHSLTERFTRLMHEEFSRLGILPPDEEPTATGAMPEIIALIQCLLARGYAYLTPQGDVYFRLSRFSNYGQLSGQNLDQLRTGERVEINPDKEDPMDFVLWKSAKPNEPAWESPFGLGRPGWHIECSAMIRQSLGETIDIHAGGSDLRFPHHENEIAQSEAAQGHPLARYWLHTGMVKVNAEKMSKSLGNFFIIAEVLKTYAPEVLRYFLISAHYQSEVHYSDENLRQAQSAVLRFYTALQGFDLNQARPLKDETYTARFEAAMNDDFNTPEAFAVLFELIREINRSRTENLSHACDLAGLLKKLSGLLGIATQDPDSFLRRAKNAGLGIKEIETLIKQREVARKARDFKTADALRDELLAKGIVLKDSPEGTTWIAQ